MENNSLAIHRISLFIQRIYFSWKCDDVLYVFERGKVQSISLHINTSPLDKLNSKITEVYKN